MATIRKIVSLNDPNYFCNKSWTLSFNFITNSWVSFHSYLPNWYMGENNFFYSGKKGCCSDFDFVFLAGELVPDPPTTTTTTTPQVPPTTTSTTTIARDCTLVGGTIEVMTCTLSGTGIILVPSPCVRPEGLGSFTLYKGYEVISPVLEVITTASLIDACNGKRFIFDNAGNVIPTAEIVNGQDLFIGAQLYENNGSTNCTPAAPGFYYTTNPIEGIYEISDTGVIVDIHLCAITTTTTTTTCPMYLYTAEFYTCLTCTFVETGTIGNSELLPIDKFFADPISGLKMKITAYLGCGSGTNRFISASAAQDNCPTVACLTTTTTTTV